jgi:hypothetical protein
LYSSNTDSKICQSFSTYSCISECQEIYNQLLNPHFQLTQPIIQNYFSGGFSCRCCHLLDFLYLPIVNCLETITDTNRTIAAADPSYDPKPLQQALKQVSQSILNWLQQDGEFQAISQDLDKLNPLFALMILGAGLTPVNRLHGEQARIRSISYQMQHIRDTDFLPPIYVLLWLFLGSSSISLLLIHVNHFSEDLTVSSLIFTSLFYLLLLIRDLDNPFQYDGKFNVDVDLTILENCRDRLDVDN